MVLDQHCFHFYPGLFLSEFTMEMFMQDVFEYMFTSLLPRPGNEKNTLLYAFKALHFK